MNESLSKDTDPVISIDHHHLGVAVGIDRVIGKSDLVTFPRRIHHKICSEIITQPSRIKRVFNSKESDRMNGLPLLRLKRKEHMYLS